jgi:hypothetical protein
MARNSRNAKKAKIHIYKPSGNKDRAGPSSMVVFTPTRTRRGKIVYTETDAAPYYALSDEDEKSPKRKQSKTPSHSTTTLPASLEDPIQWDGLCLDDQEPNLSRITKVRL